jgi:integrase/recombinase XerD
VTAPVPEPSRPPAELGDPDGLEQLVTDWLSSVHSANTRTAYRRDLAHWAAFLAERDVALLAARPPLVDAWSETLRQAGRAPATIARKLAATNSFYDYAVDAGALDTNPVAHADRPEVDRDRANPRALDVDQGHALITEAAADGPRSEAIVRLALQGGLRVAEIAAAYITDLDAEHGQHSLTVTGKDGRRGRISLPPAVAHAVDRVVDGRAEGPIITTRTGKPMAASEIYRTIVRLAAAAGITDGSLILARMREIGAREVSEWVDAVAQLYATVVVDDEDMGPADEAAANVWSGFGYQSPPAEVQRMLSQAIAVGYATALRAVRDGKLDQDIKVWRPDLSQE